LTSELLETYKQKIAALELVPSQGGCFELTVNGELIYSKLATGEFPQEHEMVRVVGAKLCA
jgi:selenoprotein W-related protein